MSASKNLPPSTKKLRKAREDGDVAKSKDFSGSLLVTSGFCYIIILAPKFHPLLDLMEKTFAGAGDFHTNNMLVYARMAWETLFNLLLPFLLFVFFVAAVVEAGQVGLSFSLKPLGLRFSRLSFFKGLKRLLGFREDGGESGLPLGLAFELAKITLYLLGFAGAMSIVACLIAPGILVWPFVEAEEVLLIGFYAFCRVVPAAALVYLFLGAIDFLLARMRRMKRLRMDVNELKREMRESEGDPETRGMRKQLHQDLLFHRVIQGVRRSKVVIADAKTS